MNLLSTMIGIGLLALVVGAGISHINPGAQAAAETAAAVAAGFQNLIQAYQSRQMTGAPPPDAAAWESALFPAYGFEPQPPEGMRWSYGVSTAGRWFCLSASQATPAMRAALAAVGKRYATAGYQVSDTCGAVPVAASPTGPTSTGSTSTTTGATGTAAATGGGVAATLWVSREGP